MPRFYIHRIINRRYVGGKEGVTMPIEKAAARDVALNEVKDIIVDRLNYLPSGIVHRALLSIDDEIGRQVIWISLSIRSYEPT